MPHSGVLTAFAPRPSTSKETQEVSKLLQRLTCLYDEKYKQLRPDELAAACMTIFESGLIVLPEEALFLEASTRLQHLSSVWHEHRVGRITASKFHASSRAGTNPPPRSLLEQLMGYKPVNSSAIPALDWGIKNEKIARMQYLERASAQHEGLEYRPSGLHVNPQFPHLGASPDGLICCECCGEGTVEIKCPYKYRQCNPMDVQDPHFCLQPNSEGMSLSHTHEYYTQVQGQLAVCQRLFCDFVCWTPCGMHVERIDYDPTYFSELKQKLDKFYHIAVLPELLTRSLKQ